MERVCESSPMTRLANGRYGSEKEKEKRDAVCVIFTRAVFDPINVSSACEMMNPTHFF